MRNISEALKNLSPPAILRARQSAAPPTEPRSNVPPTFQRSNVSTPSGWHFPHAYSLIEHFTGRAAERAELSAWLNEDAAHPLMVLRAGGGWGKSALAWRWLHGDVEAGAWPRVLWWSFYESNAGWERFVEAALRSVGRLSTLPPSSREQADALLDLLREPGTLLLLDGFERELRAYEGMGAAYQGDEVAPSPNSGTGGGRKNPLPESGEGAERSEAGEGRHRACLHPDAEHFLQRLATLPALRGKVLMTTRLLPRALEQHGGTLAGCRVRELNALAAADAVALLRAAGVSGGSDHELARAAERYGNHPLSLRLLAGLVREDAARPGDIAVAEGLELFDELKQRQTHVLAVAHERLSASERSLLARIACFRSPVPFALLARLAEDEATLRADLDTLRRRGLLERTAAGGEARYDLHPIVRGYAYRRLTEPERRASHERLRGLFDDAPVPARVERLEELQPIIELYHHTASAGHFDEARTLFRDRLDNGYLLPVRCLRATDRPAAPPLPRRRGQAAAPERRERPGVDAERPGELLQPQRPAAPRRAPLRAA